MFRQEYWAGSLAVANICISKVGLGMFVCKLIQFNELLKKRLLKSKHSNKDQQSTNVSMSSGKNSSQQNIKFLNQFL
jgi:hypothetical protein